MSLKAICQKLSIRIITLLCNIAWLSVWIIKLTEQITAPELVVSCTSMNLKISYISNMLDFILKAKTNWFSENLWIYWCQS